MLRLATTLIFFAGVHANRLQSIERRGFGFTYFGCFDELKDGLHVLNHKLDIPSGTPFDVPPCVDTCYYAGFQIGAVMNGNECWCDNAMSSRAVQLAQDDCSVHCEGVPDEYCGGVYHLQMYYTSPGGATHINPTAPASVGTAPEVYNLQGCYLDNRSARNLRGASSELPNNTPAVCAHQCYTAGFKYAGVEYGDECYCGNDLFQPKVVDSDCYEACAGDSTQLCGSPNRINIYLAATPPTPPGPVLIVGDNDSEYQYQGCYVDTVSPRTFCGYSFTSSSMTAATCAAECYNRGFAYAGVEYSSECYCNSTPPTTSEVDDAECSMVCSGDSAHTCGGGARLGVYKSSTLF